MNAKLQKFTHLSTHLLVYSTNNCRYLDDILTVNHPKFLTIVKQIYPTEPYPYVE